MFLVTNLLKLLFYFKTGKNDPETSPESPSKLLAELVLEDEYPNSSEGFFLLHLWSLCPELTFCTMFCTMVLRDPDVAQLTFR